jgi:hypothetical protein
VGALYLFEADGSFRVRTIGEESADWTERSRDFFGQPDLLRTIAPANTVVAIPSAAIPAGIAAAFLNGAAARSALVVPLNYQDSSLGAILMLSRDFDAEVRQSHAFALGVGTHITQALVVADAFRDMQAALDGVAARSTALGLVLSETGGFVLIADRIGRVLGEHRPAGSAAEAGLQGRMWTSAVDAADRQRAGETFQAAVSTRSKREMELRIDRSMTDAPAPFRVVVEPIVDDDAVTSLVVRWLPLRDGDAAPADSPTNGQHRP